MISPTMQEEAAEGRMLVDRPIIFSAPMVRALLDGRKTMTRRLAWGKPFGVDVDEEAADELRRKGYKVSGPDDTEHRIVWPPSLWQRVKPGDGLYVKEDLQRFNREPRATAQYVADITGVPHRGQVEGGCDGRAYWNWKGKYLTGRFCPRWASRLTLIVTATKIERLQEVSEEDADHEGARSLYGEPFDPNSALTNRRRFELLWRDLHGPAAWDANPEVIVLTFTIHKTNIDALPKQAAA